MYDSRLVDCFHELATVLCFLTFCSSDQSLLFKFKIFVLNTGFIGVDAGPYNVMFPTMKARASFNVSITDKLKAKKRFKLIIIKGSLPNRVTCDPHCSTKVVIK